MSLLTLNEFHFTGRPESVELLTWIQFSNSTDSGFPVDCIIIKSNNAASKYKYGFYSEAFNINIYLYCLK